LADQSARIDPIRPRLRWQALSAEDVEQLERAFCARRSTSAFASNSGARSTRWNAAAAASDRASQVARLPESVVRAALQTALTAPLLAARDPRCDVVLDGSVCHLGNEQSLSRPACALPPGGPPYGGRRPPRSSAAT
jgi:trimethylamine:corrinoid methyltransferase-like protein